MTEIDFVIPNEHLKPLGLSFDGSWETLAADIAAKIEETRAAAHQEGMEEGRRDPLAPLGEELAENLKDLGHTAKKGWNQMVDVTSEILKKAKMD